MKWTTEKPTKPGYYWYKGPVLTNDFNLADQNQWPITIAWIGDHALKGYPYSVRFMFSNVRLFFDGAFFDGAPFEGKIPDNAQWAGPIEEPE